MLGYHWIAILELRADFVLINREHDLLLALGFNFTRAFGRQQEIFAKGTTFLEYSFGLFESKLLYIILSCVYLTVSDKD